MPVLSVGSGDIVALITMRTAPPTSTMFWLKPSPITCLLLEATYNMTVYEILSSSQYVPSHYLMAVSKLLLP